MIILNKSNSNAKQTVLPILISDYLDICDPVLTFDRFMEEMDLEKYLKGIPKHCTGRLRYNPVSMLKMDYATPSYRTFGIMKQDQWYKRIVRRGMKSVRLEVFLVSIGQNLYKYHNKKRKAATAI